MNSVIVVRHIALTYVLVRKRTYEADVHVRFDIEVRIRKETYVGCCYIHVHDVVTYVSRVRVPLLSLSLPEQCNTAHNIFLHNAHI